MNIRNTLHNSKQNLSVIERDWNESVNFHFTFSDFSGDQRTRFTAGRPYTADPGRPVAQASANERSGLMVLPYLDTFWGQLFWPDHQISLMLRRNLHRESWYTDTYFQN